MISYTCFYLLLEENSWKLLEYSVDDRYLDETRWLEIWPYMVANFALKGFHCLWVFKKPLVVSCLHTIDHSLCIMYSLARTMHSMCWEKKKKEKMLMIDEWYSGRCNNNSAVRLLLQKMVTKTRFACCVLGIIFGHALLSVCIWLFSTSNKSKEEEFQVKAHKRPADLKV